MDYRDYIGFIQLAVAFNFACVSFKRFQPFAFENLFDDLKQKIKASDKEIAVQMVLLESTLDVEEDTIKKEDMEFLRKETGNLHRNIIFVKSKIDYRMGKNPEYFHHVCLVLGLYSLFLLFILGDYRNHPITDKIWPIFTIFISIYFLYFLLKEFYIYPNNSLKASSTFLTVTILMFSFFVSKPFRLL